MTEPWIAELNKRIVADFRGVLAGAFESHPKTGAIGVVQRDLGLREDEHGVLAHKVEVKVTTARGWHQEGDRVIWRRQQRNYHNPAYRGEG